MQFRAVLFASFTLLTAFPWTYTFGQTSDHVVISEILIDGVYESQASNNDEFVEIYNPTTSSVDISGWTIDYKSATSTTYTNKYVMPSGTVMQAHGYYLFGGGGVVTRDNNPAPSSTLGLGNTGGAVFIRNSSGTVIDLIGWGTTSSPNFEGAPAVRPVQGVSLERKAKSTSDAASMNAGGADEFEGNGYDSDNNLDDFVQRTTPQPQNSKSPVEPSTSSPGSGIGTASIVPSTVDAASTHDLAISFVSNETEIIDTAVIVIPSLVDWSGSPSDVSVSGSGTAGASLQATRDTVRIGGLSVGKTDTARVVFRSVTLPDSGVSVYFVLETAAAGALPSQVASQLAVSVTKIVRIIDLHINDSQGVPASPYQIGATVTISGVITSDGNPTGTDLYVQDATAGINVFSFSRAYDYQVGDSITLTGSIFQHRGTTEVLPDSARTFILAHGCKLPAPLLLTAADVNQTFNDDYSEPNEGRLVRMNGVTYNSANQTLTDVTGTTGGYISGSWNIPAGTFDLIGILKQYKPGTTSTLTPPYTADYEVVPRAQDDIIVSPGPSFVQKPEESDIQPNSVTITFRTGDASTATVRYGTTDSYTDSLVDASADSLHDMVLGGLWPATVYHYQVVAKDSSGSNTTGDALFSTASPTGSTGAIDVFFSKSVDTSVARGGKAQTVDISSEFISRINAARYSIDVALYSMSGTVGTNIANALIAAKGRGVKVRMIAEYDNSNTAPMNAVKSSGIPFITDRFDPLNAGNGLMHNKFAVFDYRDTSSFTDDWVWSGSWNATDPGNNNDAQNALEIQDKAIASAYTIEFNEMWGSQSDTPNATQSRFGLRKTDNTPHKFNVAGIPIELYFSPSDQTTANIYRTLSTATHSINVCMLTFTRSDLAQLLSTEKASGRKVRVLLDNNTDSGNQFSFLQGSGVDVLLKGSTLTGLLHHKYALIDADAAQGNESVITGSHNWSNSAETSNNENTLVIHDPHISNLYLQEFKARYIEAGGSDNIGLGVRRSGTDVPSSYALGQNYPNPFNPTTVISYRLPVVSHVTLKVYDVLGREVATLVDERESAGYYNFTFEAGKFSSGTYFYILRAGGNVMVGKMMLVK